MKNRPRTKRFKLLGHPGFYMRVYLWPSQELLAKALADSNPKVRGWYETPEVRKKQPLPTEMGSIHLYRDGWGERTLSREFTHLAFFWREAFGIKSINPEIAKTYSHLPRLLLLDEAVCHSVGSAFKAVYGWLWKTNHPS